MCAANTGSVVPADGIIIIVRVRPSVTGRGMTVIAVAAGAVTAERATSTAAAVSAYVSGRCRQQVHMGKPTAAVQCTIAGSADKIQLMLMLVLLLGA